MILKCVYMYDNRQCKKKYLLEKENKLFVLHVFEE